MATSTSREDKLFYLSFLKECGKMTKKIYNILPIEEHAKIVISYKNLIENYKI